MPNPELIVFADDWGRHPSSAQHLIRHLLGDFAVSWVNTVGTRAPKLDRALIRRGREKLAQWGQRAPAPARTGPEPQVCNPLMYPGFRTAWQRRLNASLLARFLRKQFANLAQSVVLSTVPIVADLPERLRARRWVYYCVDDFSAWPGLDSGALDLMERKFVMRVDRIVAAGDNLAGRMRALGRDSHVISHGIDLDHWRRQSTQTHFLGGFERPIVLFWGLVDRRLDLPALRALDQQLTAGTIVLVGPQQDPDPQIQGLAHLRMAGPSPYENLPSVAAEADVLIMPYADLPVTRAMQPLKLKEYLATGRPVVSTRLPAVEGWADCLDVACNPRQFAQAVQQRCGGELPEAQRTARKRLQHESWMMKAQEFSKVVMED